MKTLLLSTLFLFLSVLVHGQDEHTLQIKARPSNIKGTQLVLMMFEYNKDTIIYNSERYVVTPPKILSSREKAFGFLSFQGNINPELPSGVLVLLDGYLRDMTKLYVDKNFNFDLSDDGAPYVLKDSLDRVSVSLSNTDLPETHYEVDLQFIRFLNVKQKEMAGKMVANDIPAFKGNAFINPTYWLTETPKIHLIFDALLGEDSVKLGLVDYNLNGLYNDIDKDKILVGNYQEGSISDSPGTGSHTIGDVTLLEIGDKYYQLQEVEPTGKYIKLISSNKQKFEFYNKGKLSKGAEIPDLTLNTFEGQTTSIHKELAPDKFTLIDIWGTWCKGCISQTDKLKRLDSLYSDKLRILGLNYEPKPENIEKAKNYVLEHQIGWKQGIADKKLLTTLLVDKYPFYVLVDKNRRIHSLGVRLEEVEKVMERN